MSNSNFPHQRDESQEVRRARVGQDRVHQYLQSKKMNEDVQ